MNQETRRGKTMARDAIGDREETTLGNRTRLGRPPCEKRTHNQPHL